jgi:hypothetical protein
MVIATILSLLYISVLSYNVYHPFVYTVRIPGCMIAIFFIGSMLLFSTFLSQGVFADSMSERMKIREEFSGVSSDDQNIMSATPPSLSGGCYML